MRRFVALIFLFLIFTAPLFAKQLIKQHLGTLLMLRIPTMSSAYVMLLYLDDGSVGILAAPKFFTDHPFPCQSYECMFSNATVDSLLNACSAQDYCAQAKSVWYETGRAKRRDGEDCITVGIQFGDHATIWIVPGQMTSASAINKTLFDALPANAPKWNEGQPSSATDWIAYVDFVRLAEEGARNLAVATKLMQLDQMSRCLRSLHIGDPSSSATKCGIPDHTNADLRTDQLVYSEGTIVYIDKATDTVENVQWTHFD
jgi:hypothetical protein